LARLPLPQSVSQDIEAQETKLAGLPVPADVDPATRAAIKETIAQAFIFGFRALVLLCAGMSVASSAVAWRMIPKGAAHPSSG
jgi:hypothetical protein